MESDVRTVFSGVGGVQEFYRKAQQTILDEAKQLVFGPREKMYAHPRVDFKRAAGMVNALFGDKLKAPLTEADWALIMIICKMARQVHAPETRDGWVDIAGYAETGARVTGVDE